jgi:hypothetical protein
MMVERRAVGDDELASVDQGNADLLGELPELFADEVADGGASGEEAIEAGASVGGDGPRDGGGDRRR